MRYIAGFIIGAVIGAAIGYAGKCKGGSCPLTGNPFISAFIGGLAGIMIAAKPPELKDNSAKRENEKEYRESVEESKDVK